MKLDSINFGAGRQLPISLTSSSVSKNIFVAEEEKALSAVRDKFCIISHSIGGRRNEEEEAGSSKVARAPGQNNTFGYQNIHNAMGLTI